VWCVWWCVARWVCECVCVCVSECVCVSKCVCECVWVCCPERISDGTAACMSFTLGGSLRTPRLHAPVARLTPAQACSDYSTKTRAPTLQRLRVRRRPITPQL